MNVTIRPAQPADLEAITAIYADAVLTGTASYELDPPDAEEMAARYRAVTEAGYPYLVAGPPGAVAGYAYAAPFRPRPAYRFMAENSVYVARDARGYGLGRRLMQHLIADLAALGFRQVCAVIGDGSALSPSVRLHRSLGFTQCGTIRGSGYKFDRWLDTVLMQLELNGGTSSPPDPRSLPEQVRARQNGGVRRPPA